MLVVPRPTRLTVVIPETVSVFALTSIFVPTKLIWVPTPAKVLFVDVETPTVVTWGPVPVKVRVVIPVAELYWELKVIPEVLKSIKVASPT